MAVQDVVDASKSNAPVGEGLTNEERAERGDFVGDEEGEGEGGDDDPDKGKKDAGEDEGEGGGDADADALTELANEGEEGASTNGKSPVVPHSRFNQVNEDKIRLETENRMLREELERNKGRPAAKEEPEVPKFDVKAARAKMREHLSMGEEDEADAIQDQIDAHLVETAAARGRNEALQEVTQRVNQETLQAAADAIVVEQPYLNPKHEDYNATAFKTVVSLRNTYISEGMAPAAALRKAAADMAEMRGEKGGGEGKGKGADKGQQREDNALARGAKAADRQPARTEGGKGMRGGRETPKDVTEMDDSQFRNMPKEDKRAARGDNIS